MKSIVALEWLPDDPEQHRKQKRKIQIESEKERLKQIYEQKVEEKLHQRYLNNLDHSRMKADNKNSRLDDTLSKQLEAFNTSKVNQLSPNPENGLYQPEFQQSLPKSYNLRPNSRRKSTYDQQQGPLYPFHSQDLNNRHSSVPRQNHNLEPETRRYETISIESPRPQLTDSRAPFPGKLGYRQIEEMYTGYSPEQYPFRNVKPDNLETYLREKTKADHKRAINVTLNLFKH